MLEWKKVSDAQCFRPALVRPRRTRAGRRRRKRAMMLGIRHILKGKEHYHAVTHNMYYFAIFKLLRFAPFGDYKSLTCNGISNLKVCNASMLNLIALPSNAEDSRENRFPIDLDLTNNNIVIKCILKCQNYKK